MILFRKSDDLRNYLLKSRLAGQSIGFVPTMGALHAGHLQLVSECRAQTGLSVVSIFVNPTQFNDPNDFRKYPKTIEEDIRMLEEAGTDILFYPTLEQLYPNGTKELEHYELGFLEEVLEGSSRPGHFQGVCQVMNRLLSIVQPNHLFMGQKDYQQCMVVKELIRQEHLKMEFHTIPTLREADGLAMSSRNRRLDAAHREIAAAIYQTLVYIQDTIQPGSLAGLKEKAILRLESKGFRVDYISISDASTLEELAEWDGHRQVVALAAAFLQEVRLIDNLLLSR